MRSEYPLWVMVAILSVVIFALALIAYAFGQLTQKAFISSGILVLAAFGINALVQIWKDRSEKRESLKSPLHSYCSLWESLKKRVSEKSINHEEPDIKKIRSIALDIRLAKNKARQNQSADLESLASDMDVLANELTEAFGRDSLNLDSHVSKIMTEGEGLRKRVMTLLDSLK